MVQRWSRHKFSWQQHTVLMSSMWTIEDKCQTRRSTVLAFIGYNNKRQGDAYSIRRSSVKIVQHQDYNTGPQFTHDVALIKLGEPVAYTDAIRPICLPEETESFRDRSHTPLVITGWGNLACVLIRDSLCVDL